MVATRPRERNGLGFTPQIAAQHLAAFADFATYKPDNSHVHAIWKRLVTEGQISGKDAHDAGYVAAMLAHSLDNLLTLDADDFRRHRGVVGIFTPKELMTNPRLLEITRSVGLPR